MPTKAMARQMTETAGFRRPYLLAVPTGLFLVDLFAGLAVSSGAAEHWLQAGGWGAATLVYLVLAWRRPLPAARRPVDWIVAGAMALFGVVMVLRATLSDATAFRWALVLMAASVAVWF